MACEKKALSRCIPSSSSRNPSPRITLHRLPSSTRAASSSSSSSTSSAASTVTPPNFTFAPSARRSQPLATTKAFLADHKSAASVNRAVNLTAHPHTSSYAALLSRVAGAEVLQGNLALVEACCICPSFWADVDALDAATSPAKGPFTLFHDTDRLDNRQLSSLGNALLGLFATEWLERRMPNLPTSVMKSAVTMFVGPHTASDVARTWGVLPGRASFLASEAGDAPTSQKSNSGHRERKSSVRGQGEGWRAGTGVLRWSRNQVPSSKESGLEVWQNGSTFQDAMACVAKAFVGAIHQEKVCFFTLYPLPIFLLVQT